MQLIFGASHSPGSLLIRAATFSIWSHVGVIVGDECVIEARWPKVRMTTLRDFETIYSMHEIAFLDCADEAAATTWLHAQIGKPYDWQALFAFPLQRDWQEDDAWFCSELPTMAALVGGTRHFRDDQQHRITPGQLFSVCW